MTEVIHISSLSLQTDHRTHCLLTLCQLIRCWYGMIAGLQPVLLAWTCRVTGPVQASAQDRALRVASGP